MAPCMCRAEGGCERDYHWADKPLQRCYVCFQLGHLCCLSAPKKMKPSCYNCGESGHLGDDCQRTKTPKLCAERSGKGMDAVVDDYDTDRFSGRGRWEKDSRSPYGNEPRRRPSYYDRISQDPRASWSKNDHASLPSSRDSYHRDRSNSLGRWNSAPQGWVSGSSGGHRSSGLDSRPSQRYSADSRSGHHARKHNSSHRRTYE
ncbi:unnamed protein product [Ostreobium quekettii]|uniref:CCHC-type domain-containing protein n=1 Tax=Ostreobium quekettii TaxID=121088 RepID=A0A8S1IWX1_9CHLO|nr:unnamed protein product [Ostreobium quekettii]